MNPQYRCKDEERRAAVQGSALNGIDFLEVLDRDATDERLRQRLLIVRTLSAVVPALAAENARIVGGVRLTPIRVEWAMPLPDVAGADLDLVPQWQKNAIAAHFVGEAAADQVFLVLTDSEGDYSSYTLRLIDPSDPDEPASGFDPRLATVDFSFKVECSSDFDCKAEEVCSPLQHDEPRLDYLAKDYSSFTRAMFDRMSVIAPDWRERSPADMGVALVELMAFVGDRLSYFQDAVATEAYLGTARRRTSIRRHARLVDYTMHEGVNARAWVQLQVGPVADGAMLPAQTVLSTPGHAPMTLRDPSEIETVRRQGGLFFETMHALTLRESLNEVSFYTWSNRECCLPKGATRATLRSDPIPGLSAGGFLLFEEVLGPKTGAAADADPLHRHVVRLTSVNSTVDPLDGTPLIEIGWSTADALPFALCISGTTDDDHGGRYVEDVSVARGNLVLTDHGLRLEAEPIGTVPDEPRFFRPALSEGPVTHAVPLEPGFPDEEPALPAAELTDYNPRDGVAQVRLDSADGAEWQPQSTLLNSDRFATEFVLEVDQDRATVRMGDDVNGLRPEPGLSFQASYRVGQGTAGNVGAETISQLFSTQAGILQVRNPLAARGGVEPESMEEVRRYAPQAFREQRRAVTEEDYAWATELHPDVQRAAATFRWTGSWYTVFVTVDRRDGFEVDAVFERRLRAHLAPFRTAGYDLEVDAPRYVPLEIELEICVETDFQRSAVKQELLEVLGCRVLADGTTGFFHPDRWTFGQTVYLSQIVAAAMAVAGVASVEPRVFKRQDRLADGELEARMLTTERLEIPRLDNDPSLQEHGLLTLTMGGGR